MTETALISNQQLMADLERLISLPGSYGQRDRLVEVAAFIADMMRRRKFQTDVVETDGAPIVIGRRAGRKPFTVLLYHHYDVAPPGSWRAWHHDPYQMAERDGMLYGRGVARGKGPLAAHLNALMALADAEGELPCSVVIVAEGEYLHGSVNLGPAMAECRALFKADACLVSAGDLDASGLPFCYSGSKGFVRLRLHAGGSSYALGPGLAASVTNPLWRLIWALGHIKSEQEEILINGFYDSIEGPDRDESRALRLAQIDEQHRKEDWNVARFLFDMSGAALVQTEVTLPTCNVSALTVEPHSDLGVIPTSASALVDFQLVPRQHPQEVIRLLHAHLNEKGFGDIKVERLPGSYPAASTKFDHPFAQLVSEAGRQVYGAPLPRLSRGAFALPLFFFAEGLGVPVVSVGYTGSATAAHAPNEHIPMIDLIRCGQMLIDTLYACGRLQG